MRNGWNGADPSGPREDTLGTEPSGTSHRSQRGYIGCRKAVTPIANGEPLCRTPSESNGLIGVPPEPRPAQRPRRMSSLPPRPSRDDPDDEAKATMRMIPRLLSAIPRPRRTTRTS